uniref:Uncharacterized protein n=1 Tax=Wuchereria bancrofti TaxID=6293 RepID=A0AAF5PYW6_WUCBA
MNAQLIREGSNIQFALQMKNQKEYDAHQLKLNKKKAKKKKKK